MNLSPYAIRVDDALIVCPFNSVQDVLEAKPHERNASNHFFRLRETEGESWYGLPGSWESILDTVRTGWVDGVAKVEESLEELPPLRLPSVHRKRVRADRGFNLDMTQVYNGRLDACWTSFSKIAEGMSQKHTNVELIVNIGKNASVSAEEYFWDGATALALARALTQSGRSVRILGVIPVKDLLQRDASDVVLSVVIKDYHHALDMNALASSICLPAFFRIGVFGVLRSFKYPKKSLGHSHGAGWFTSQNMDRSLGKPRGNTIRLVVSGMYSARSSNKALSKMATQLGASTDARRFR